jgi:N6-adenosine-specific RNA methylase IME4
MGNTGGLVYEYQTMPLEDICRMPIQTLAADDSILLLWATWPKLAEAMHVIESWGFRYLTGLPWIKIVGEPRRNLWGDLDIKPQYGIGYWVRTCSELVLIARRGNVSPPEGGSIGLLSENFGHSRKPDNLYDYAERLPGPYLEMFARRPRPGWDSYGNEIVGGIALEVPA